ncbi:hypothetical protein VTJ04DRAFT_1093 [Mycothermus thermophilus]|uniref:uncharacterized protein n=1 Tax=Humicola insolens TaxID=85995 RepID=UPI003742CA3A
MRWEGHETYLTFVVMFGWLFGGRLWCSFLSLIRWPCVLFVSVLYTQPLSCFFLRFFGFPFSFFVFGIILYFLFFLLFSGPVILLSWALFFVVMGGDRTHWLEGLSNYYIYVCISNAVPQRTKTRKMLGS